MRRRLDSDRLRSVLLLLLPAAAAVYLAYRNGGPAAAVLAVIAVGCLTALMLRAAPGTFDAELAGRAANAALLALPGALTVYFAFNAGGFFPETPAFVAIVLILVLVVRIMTAEDPFAGFSWPLAVAAGALALYCVWVLVSGSWSDAPGRAFIEFDRAFMYLVALVLFGSLPRSSRSLRWMVRGVALGIVAVAVAGFLTRTLPDVFPTDRRLYEGRLGYPLTYWNAVGMLAATGSILCLHLTASLRERMVVRVLAAASLPVLCATVLLTFSRGAILAGFVGLVVYAIVGRPRGLASAVIAAVPLSVLAVHAAYDANLLGTDRATSPAGADQGHDVALLVAACCLGAAVLRFGLRPLDSRLRRFTLPERSRVPVTRAAWAAGIVLVLVAAVAFDVRGRVDTQYDKFVNASTSGRPEEARDRLRDAANTGRIEQWDVALDGFRGEALHGTGAGTYGLEWMRERPNTLVIDDAHSLYLESLEELGLVGLALVAIVVLTLLASTAPWRARDRSLEAVLFAAFLALALHAGIDWDWEMPAVMAWLFCVGGAAMARGARSTRRGPRPTSGARLVLGTVVLIGALAPVLLFVSQRQLDDAVAAFQRGDCVEASERAAASIRTLEIRPEPYEVLGFCDVRRGFDQLAVPALEHAVERDPDNWEFRYGLAIVRGSAGLDPRPAADAALRLNPRDVLTQSLVQYADTSDPRKWVARMRPIAKNERLSVVD